MAIDLEWQNERGETLARYEGPPLTANVVSGAPSASVCVRFIDPYGDTTFNQLQVASLIKELQELPGVSPRLIEFVRGGVESVHAYLKFIGD